MRFKKAHTKGKGKPKLSIRVDECMLMQLKELSNITGQSMSVVIRMLLIKSIRDITDKAGRFTV